jgi:hypothetical protein
MPAYATVVATGFVDPSVIGSNARDEVSVNVNLSMIVPDRKRSPSRLEAEDCALPDERKRELFERLAADLRNLAHEIERVITAQKI